MAIEEPPLTRSELRAELREELDRTLRHYATKADLAALETRITAAMASQAEGGGHNRVTAVTPVTSAISGDVLYYTLTGSYGDLQLQPDGDWVYTIDEARPHFDTLNQAHANEDFRITVVDDRRAAGDKEHDFNLRVLVAGTHEETKGDTDTNANPWLLPQDRSDVQLRFDIPEDEGRESDVRLVRFHDPDLRLDPYSSLGIGYGLESSPDTLPVVPGNIDAWYLGDLVDSTRGTDLEVEGEYGTFRFNREDAPHVAGLFEHQLSPDGRIYWTYQLNSDDPRVQALDTGETAYDVVFLQVTDYDGGRSEVQMLQARIIGSTDAQSSPAQAPTQTAFADNQYEGGFGQDDPDPTSYDIV